MSVLSVAGIVLAAIFGLAFLAFALFGILIFVAILYSGKQDAIEWKEKSR